jgi:hypothetical protein
MTQDIMAWDVEDGVVLPHQSDEPVVGIRSVLQRVLCKLLNETDSPCYTFDEPWPPTCDFMVAWRNGHINNESDVFAHFGVAVTQITPAMLAEQGDDDPPDQQFKALKLTRIVLHPEAAHLEITLETAGGSEDFTLPLPT